jgi:succinyl-CoA synthetase beta subunit
VNLHEYQSKALFAQFGLPTPKGKVATTPDEAYQIAQEIGGVVVVKAQVLTGGRGKAGGVKLAKTPDEAKARASEILGMKIKGLTVNKVLIDPGADIKQEIYLAVTNDRAARRPLGAGTLMALDGKISLDDNALMRHADLVPLRDIDAEPPEETKAREAGLNFIKLDGNIGCMVNGAGLAMTTMDITSDIAKKMGVEGGGPANFLDVGGGAKADKVSTALQLILSDPKVKAILMNIFGGITRGDEVARGVIQAMNEVQINVPLIVRLAGTNAEEGRKIIEEAHIPNLISASTLYEAAEKAVLAAKG